MLLSLFALLTIASAADDSFAYWVEKYGKVYATEEEYKYREVVFTKNAMAIEARNAEQSHVVLGLNKFADLTPEEFWGTHKTTPKTRALRGTPAPLFYGTLPTSVDWVAAGAVTPVKNQGQCGSCWSFSTTGSVEGAWFIKHGQLISLSEQQLVDCSSAYGNMGCNGGLMDNAFQYIIANHGICSEADYPYISAGGANETCHSCTPVATLASYVDVTPKNETALMVAVAQQPVSVAVEADGLDWQFYFGGVVKDACGTNLDHGVLVVGYGTDATAGDFWKVKNSWGPDWGEQGYIRLGRGASFAPNGECGILLSASYPIVA
jgi:C1A family cysteine protease